MPDENLGTNAIRLAEESAEMLERWLALFEMHLQRGEQEDRVVELKELVAFTTALKRLLEIGRIAKTLSPEVSDEGVAALDSETIRTLLSEED